MFDSVNWGRQYRSFATHADLRRERTRQNDTRRYPSLTRDRQSHPHRGATTARRRSRSARCFGLRWWPAARNLSEQRLEPTLPTIAVFDDIFVDENVFSGLAVEPDHRQKLHELILGVQGVNLNHELQQHVAHIEEHNRLLRIKADAIPAAARGSLNVDDFCRFNPGKTSMLRFKRPNAISRPRANRSPFARPASST